MAAGRGIRDRLPFAPKGRGAKDAGAGRGEFSERTPYEFTPSFIHHNGLVCSIAQLYVRRGSNRLLTYTDVIDVIPKNPRHGVKIYLMEYDGVIKDDEKKTLIRTNAGDTKKVMENEDVDEATGKGGRLMRHDKDASEREQDRADRSDYDAYELVLDSADPVVFYRWQIVVTGPSQESVDEQLEDLNRLLDQRHSGMRWDMVAGDQKERYAALFKPIEKRIDGTIDTSTSRNFAGLNLAASPGLCDERGVIIGDDVLSLVQSAACFDFDGATRGEAYIAIPSSERMGLYEADGREGVPVASIMAQACANDIVCCGHRAFHIVLNSFNYMDDLRGYRRPKSDAAFKAYDVAKMTINPLQGFGRTDEVTQVYPRLTAKIANIFNLLNDLIFERHANGTNYRGLTAEAISNFYLRHQLWASDAATHPGRTNIVEVRHPETYPTMGLLLQEFTNLVADRRGRGAENEATMASALKSVLSNALDAYMPVLGATTSITDSDALQTYFSFRHIADRRMVQVQFLNILDYVLYQMAGGDVLCVHGADALYRILLNDYCVEAMRAAQRRGVRIVFAFDCVTSPETSEDGRMCASDVFSMRGPWYTDFGSDPSWSMMGAMLDEELDRYAHVMNNAQLSATIRVQAGARGMCQALLHRNSGNVNNFIQLAPII